MQSPAHGADVVVVLEVVLLEDDELLDDDDELEVDVLLPLTHVTSATWRSYVPGYEGCPGQSHPYAHSFA